MNDVHNGVGSSRSAMTVFFSQIHPDYTYSLLFFSMTRRPPRSTLFPTRRSSDLFAHAAIPGPRPHLLRLLCRSLGRSEEHTSELQSRFDLVCRLLLEKKKNSQLDVRREHHDSASCVLAFAWYHVACSRQLHPDSS